MLIKSSPKQALLVSVEVEVNASPYGYTFYKIGKLVILNVEYAVIGRQPEIMEIPFGYAPAKSVKFYVTYKTPQGLWGCLK